MTNALVIRASVALIEAGFTRDEVLELLLTKPDLPHPHPVKVWDSADYWERNSATGLWTVRYDNGDFSEGFYADWNWERLRRNYPVLWTDSTETVKVPKDAW